MIKRLYFGLFLSGLLLSVPAFAAVPAGYYAGTDGLMKVALKTKLYDLIKVHTSLSYADLWTAFVTTDKRADGKVWDIYSNNTNYIFITNQCGNYSGEGSCYNREHSFPKSWFGGEIAPMYTDLFHLYPSDGYVNGMRSNYPFGNVSGVTYNSANNYSLLGTSTESGTSMIVFEPADELKGDMARTYFYMVTRYENLVSAWKSNPNTEMLSGNSYPALSNWAIKVLLEWNRLDPVSAKERARNDVIYANFQHNRNPYIDYPSLAEYVWGDSTTYAFHPANYLSAVSVQTTEPAFQAWSENGNLHVQASAGKKIEILDETGRLVVRSVSQQTETTLQVGSKRFVLVRVDSQVQKVIL
jgi:endonuclease I